MLCIEEGNYKLNFRLPINTEIYDFESRFVKINNTEIIALIRDVSESKSYEKKLQTSNRLKQLT